MQTIRLIHIQLSSFIKIFTIAGICTGFVSGILALITGPVDIYFGSYVPPFYFAAIIGVMMSTVIGFIAALLAGIITYFPFLGILKLMKGIKMEVEFEMVGECDEQTQPI